MPCPCMPAPRFFPGLLAYYSHRTVERPINRALHYQVPRSMCRSGLARLRWCTRMKRAPRPSPLCGLGPSCNLYPPPHNGGTTLEGVQAGRSTRPMR